MGVWKTWVAAASMVVLAGTAQAAYVLNTGTPTGTGYNSLLDLSDPFIGRSTQHLGVTFNLAQASSITSVEGYVATDTTGALLFELHAGATPTGALLFSSLVAIGTTGEAWLGASGLDWDVAAGDYTLTLIAQPGFSGHMSYDPPAPAGAEWAKTSSGWVSTPNNMGWRIAADPAAVPAPATFALAALALAGLALPRQRKAH